MRKRINNTAMALLGSGVLLWIVAAIGYWRWKAALVAGALGQGVRDATGEYVTYAVPLWLRLVTIAAIGFLVAGAVAVIPGGSEDPRKPRR